MSEQEHFEENTGGDGSGSGEEEQGSAGEYDSTGYQFLIFLDTVLLLALLPAVWARVKKLLFAEKHPELELDAEPCNCEDCEAKRQRYFRSMRKKPWTWKDYMFWICLAAFIGLSFYISTLEHEEEKLWDPYQILDVGQDVTEKEVKKAYKTLSLRYHPDRQVDKLEEEVEAAASMYMEVTLARDTLLDPVKFDIWKRYGHPEANTQARVMGVALPSWLISSENQLLTVSIYLVIFVVGLPLAIGMWYARTAGRHSASGLLITTCQIFYGQLREGMNVWGLIDTAAVAVDFEPVIKMPDRKVDDSKSNQAAIQKLTQAVIETSAEPNEHLKIIAPIEKSVWRWRKNRLMIMAYLHRVPIEKLPAPFNDDVAFDQLIQMLPGFCTAFLEICQTRRELCRLEMMQTIFNLHQAFIQGCMDFQYPIQQVPHFHRALCIKLKDEHNITKIEQWVKLSIEKQEDILKKENFTEKMIADAMRFLKRYPKVEIELPDDLEEKFGGAPLSPGLNVNLPVNLTRKNMWDVYHTKEEELEAERRKSDIKEETDMENFDPDDHVETVARKENVLFADKVFGPVVHAPRFPTVIFESWWVILLNKHTGQVYPGIVSVGDLRDTKTVACPMDTGPPLPPQLGQKPKNIPIEVVCVSQDYMACAYGLNTDIKMTDMQTRQKLQSDFMEKKREEAIKEKEEMEDEMRGEKEDASDPWNMEFDSDKDDLDDADLIHSDDEGVSNGKDEGPSESVSESKKAA
eukprot:Clim_evm43s251 gene=Clim_evmTU43s251